MKLIVESNVLEPNFYAKHQILVSSMPKYVMETMIVWMDLMRIFVKIPVAIPKIMNLFVMTLVVLKYR